MAYQLLPKQAAWLQSAIGSGAIALSPLGALHVRAQARGHALLYNYLSASSSVVCMYIAVSYQCKTRVCPCPHMLVPMNCHKRAETNLQNECCDSPCTPAQPTIAEELLMMPGVRGLQTEAGEAVDGKCLHAGLSLLTPDIFCSL